MNREQCAGGVRQRDSARSALPPPAVSRSHPLGYRRKSLPFPLWTYDLRKREFPARSRLADESSLSYGLFSLLHVTPHVNLKTTKKQAEKDAVRISEGTVPGTVPSATSSGVLMEAGGWVLSAILRPVCAATCGPSWKVIRRRTLVAIRSPTSRPTRIVVRRLTCGATCRGTCGWTAAVTSTASCGLRRREHLGRVPVSGLAVSAGFSKVFQYLRVVEDQFGFGNAPKIHQAVAVSIVSGFGAADSLGDKYHGHGVPALVPPRV